MDIFRNGYWPGTLILLFLGLLVAFIVLCLLGLFVDPSMTQDTRESIVIGWATITMVICPITCIARHG